MLRLPNELLDDIFLYASLEDKVSFGLVCRRFFEIQEAHYKIKLKKKFGIKWVKLIEDYGEAHLDRSMFIYHRVAYIKKWKHRGHVMPAGGRLSACIFVKTLPEGVENHHAYLDEAFSIGNLNLVDSLINTQKLVPTEKTQEKAFLSGKKSVVQYGLDKKYWTLGASNSFGELIDFFRLAAVRGDRLLIEYLRSDYKHTLLNHYLHNTIIESALRSRNKELIQIFYNQDILRERMLGIVDLQIVVLRFISEDLTALLTSHSLSETARLLEQYISISSLRGVISPQNNALILHLRGDFIVGTQLEVSLNIETLLIKAIANNNQSLVRFLQNKGVVVSSDIVLAALKEQVTSPTLFQSDLPWIVGLIESCQAQERMLSNVEGWSHWFSVVKNCPLTHFIPLSKLLLKSAYKMEAPQRIEIMYKALKPEDSTSPIYRCLKNMRAYVSFLRNPVYKSGLENERILSTTFMLYVISKVMQSGWLSDRDKIFLFKSLDKLQLSAEIESLQIQEKNLFLDSVVFPLFCMLQIFIIPTVLKLSLLHPVTWISATVCIGFFREAIRGIVNLDIINQSLNRLKRAEESFDLLREKAGFNAQSTIEKNQKTPLLSENSQGLFKRPKSGPVYSEENALATFSLN